MSAISAIDIALWDISWQESGRAGLAVAWAGVCATRCRATPTPGSQGAKEPEEFAEKAAEAIRDRWLERAEVGSLRHRLPAARPQAFRKAMLRRNGL